MSLEQTIKDTIVSESYDLDGRLQQLVRAGLMPANTIPVLRKAISKVQGGMTLQGAERDVMANFINSMMFIVLGDDAIFNRARAGAKSYATEEKEKQEYDYEGDMAMGQLKSIIANSQRMHDMLSDDTNLPEWVQSKITLAEDYISTASNYMQGEMNEEQVDEGSYKDNPRHMGTIGPITTDAERRERAKKYREKLTKEDIEQIDELSNRTLGSYVKKAKKELSSSDYHVGRAVGARETGQKSNFSPELERKLAKRGKKRYHGIDKAVDKMMTKEEIEQVDEISKATLGSYVKKASGAEQPKNVMSPKNVPLTKIAAYQGDSETGHFGKRFNQHTYDKAERLRKNRETGIKRAVDKLTKEDVELEEGNTTPEIKKAYADLIKTPSGSSERKTAIRHYKSLRQNLAKEEVEQVDEVSKRTLGRYINKAKDSIDMTSYRSGIKDGTAISSSTPYKSNNPLEKKLSKRHKGIETAVKKLTKEDIDAAKSMNESYKNKFDAALEHYNIKSPSELGEEQRKEFFNLVDQEYKKGDK